MNLGRSPGVIVAFFFWDGAAPDEDDEVASDDRTGNDTGNKSDSGGSPCPCDKGGWYRTWLAISKARKSQMTLRPP